MKILQNMCEVLKGLKYRGSTKIYCPKCGSAKMRLSSSLDYWLTPKKYFCENCGYFGPIVLEIEIDKEEKQN